METDADILSLTSQPHAYSDGYPLLLDSKVVHEPGNY